MNNWSKHIPGNPWKVILSGLTKLPLMLLVSLLTLTSLVAQVPDEANRLFWSEDSLLTTRIDTMGKDYVLSEIRHGLRSAFAYCLVPDRWLSADSVSTWITWMRWAVILNDAESIETIDTLIPMVQEGERGNWKYHFTYMALWASFEGHHRGTPLHDRANMILDKLESGTPVENVFYESRMTELGFEGIPLILDWVRSNLIPHMHELDREMLSEADLEFSTRYERFLSVFSTMLVSDRERQMVGALKLDVDPNVQRFARDVLEAGEF
jgi:hypothetical protein